MPLFVSLALLNFVIRELLEVASKPEHGAHPGEPLGGVVLVPPDRVAIVHRELMVEVVVALAERAQRGDDVVAGSVLVVEGCLPEPVRE